MTNLTKLRKEFEKQWDKYGEFCGGYGEDYLIDSSKVWSFIEHSLQKAVKEEQKRIIGEIEPRLYSLWANIDYVYNKRAREQAKELLDLLEELTQKPKGK